MFHAQCFGITGDTNGQEEKRRNPNERFCYKLNAFSGLGKIKTGHNAYNGKDCRINTGPFEGSQFGKLLRLINSLFNFHISINIELQVLIKNRFNWLF